MLPHTILQGVNLVWGGTNKNSISILEKKIENKHSFCSGIVIAIIPSIDFRNNCEI